MEIRRRKDFFGITVNFNLIVWLKNDYIVVDAKIRIVKIFMLATDANNSFIRQSKSCGAHSIEGPNRTIFAIRWYVEEIPGTIGSVRGLEHAVSHLQSNLFEPPLSLGMRRVYSPDHPFPEGKGHSFGVGSSEARPPLLIEDFPSDFHQSNFPPCCAETGEEAEVDTIGIDIGSIRTSAMRWPSIFSTMNFLP